MMDIETDDFNMEKCVDSIIIYIESNTILKYNLEYKKSAI